MKILGIITGILAAFISGGLVGMNLSSSVWGRLSRDAMLSHAMNDIRTGLAVLDDLEAGETNRAVWLLEMHIESGLSTLALNPGIADQSMLSTNSALRNIKSHRRDEPFADARPEVLEFLQRIKDTEQPAAADLAGSAAEQ